MNKKRVCFVTTIPMTIDWFVTPFGKEFVKRGFEVYYITSNITNAFREKHNYAKCIEVPMARGFNPLKLFKGIKLMKKVLKEYNFESIFYGTPNASFITSHASKQINIKKRIYLQWGYRYIGFKNPLLYFLAKQIERATFKNSTHSVIVSKKNREIAIKEKFCTAENSGVAGVGGVGGADTYVTEKLLKENKKDAIRVEYNIPVDSFVFGFTGRICTDKGMNELINAFVLLKQKYTDNITLVLQGPDDVQTKKTKKIIARAKTNKDIIFINRLEHSEALRVMSTFDVLVHPTYRDGFGTTIEEAMALRIPCITTNIPGPSEVLENEVNGLLVNVKDDQDLSNAMERYLLDSNLRKKHSENAYEYATKNYGIEKCTKEYVDYLERLVN